MKGLPCCVRIRMVLWSLRRTHMLLLVLRWPPIICDEHQLRLCVYACKSQITCIYVCFLFSTICVCMCEFHYRPEGSPRCVSCQTTSRSYPRKISRETGLLGLPAVIHKQKPAMHVTLLRCIYPHIRTQCACV